MYVSVRALQYLRADETKSKDSIERFRRLGKGFGVHVIGARDLPSWKQETRTDLWTCAPGGGTRAPGRPVWWWRHQSFARDGTLEVFAGMSKLYLYKRLLCDSIHHRKERCGAAGCAVGAVRDRDFAVVFAEALLRHSDAFVRTSGSDPCIGRLVETVNGPFQR